MSYRYNKKNYNKTYLQSVPILVYVKMNCCINELKWKWASTYIARTFTQHRCQSQPLHKYVDKPINEKLIMSYLTIFTSIPFRNHTST